MATLAALAVAIVVAVVAMTLLVGAGRRWATGRSEYQTVLREQHHDIRVSVVSALLLGAMATLLGAIAASWYGAISPIGPRSYNMIALIVAVAPGVAAMIVIGAQALGELTWPKPATEIRQAALEVRTADRVASLNIRWAPRLWAALTWVCTLIFALTASGPSWLTRLITPQHAFTLPGYPGWKYSLPISISAAIVMMSGEGLLKLIATRPAVPDQTEDAQLRRRSADRVLRVEQLFLATALAGMLAVGSQATLAIANGINAALGTQVPPSLAYAIAGYSMAFAAVAVLLAATLVALWPVRYKRAATRRSGIPSRALV